MKTIEMHDYCSNVIGKRGENDAVQAIFDYSMWEVVYGSGYSVDLLVQRPGDEGPYLVDCEKRNGKLYWKVSSTDTQYAGRGTAILRMTNILGLVVKSRDYRFTVEDSLVNDTEADPPQPFESWVNKVLAAKDEINNALMEVESVACNRSYPANVSLIADNNVYDVSGVPQYLTTEMAQLYTGKIDAESGWYWFGGVIAPNGMKVEKQAFQFYGSKDAMLHGQPNDGDDRITVAIRFDALGSPVGFHVKWNSTMQNADPFTFRCTDLAIRNLDYKTTYYVYNLEPYAVVTDEKVTFEGMTPNVTYQYKERLSKPVEIILPDIEDEDGHGVWLELQLYFTGVFSCTLVPPEGVVIKKAPTPTIASGYNVLDLMYYNIDGVKCWRVQNTQSTI